MDDCNIEILSLEFNELLSIIQMANNKSKLEKAGGTFEQCFELEQLRKQQLLEEKLYKLLYELVKKINAYKPFPIDNTIEDFRNTYGNRTLNGSDLALIRGIFREEFNYFGVELRKYITSEIKNVTNFTAVDKIDVDNYLNDDVDKIDVDEVGIDDKENVVENSTRKYVSEIDKTNRRIAPPVKYFNLHSVTKKLEYFPKIESIYGELIKDVDLKKKVTKKTRATEPVEKKGESKPRRKTKTTQVPMEEAEK
ncbi:hypothetical protein QTN25_000613 [Entamoeba marina]